MSYFATARTTGVCLALKAASAMPRTFALTTHGMLRDFTDKEGIPWRVWDVYPSERGKSGPTEREIATAELKGRFRSAELAEGWLCFESPTERRRLAPIPPGWEFADSKVLEEMLSRAGYVSRRTSDPTGKSAPTDDSEFRSDARE